MKFIVFEGIDGCGKSTLMKGLTACLTTQEIEFVTTREPGGTSLGTDIRQLILRTDGEAPAPRAELLLYEADRAHHVENFICPNLEQGKWVLSDRYYSSTIAFQAGGRNLKREDIDWLNRFAVNDCEPDLWVLLDLSIEESATRMNRRNNETSGKLDRMELEKSDFHQRVRESYLQQAKESKGEWLVLDARKSPEQLQEELIDVLRGKGWLK